MRYTSLLLIVILAPSSGCSALIAATGHDPSKLKTMEQVHARFGKPTCCGATNEKQFERFAGYRCFVMEDETFENYHTRRKISDPCAGYYLMGFGMTFGLSELLVFPGELFLLGRNTLVGQNVCFTYDPDGAVTNVFVNGAQYPNLRQSDHVPARLLERFPELYSSEPFHVKVGFEMLGEMPMPVSSRDFKCIK